MDLYRVVAPVLRLFDPEQAHHLALLTLKCGLGRVSTKGDDPVLATNLWGHSFSNPIGLAAGFDKNAEVIDAMLRIGFGFVEVGTVTPRAQPGLPRPRIFRLNEDDAIINRLGFPSIGAPSVADHLATRGRGKGIIGVNLGANKDSPDRTEDYVKGLTILQGLADYFVINVSSPNTSGLRELQTADALTGLLRLVMNVKEAWGCDIPSSLPILVKIAPDLDVMQLESIVEVVLNCGVDGLIVSNTSISRPENLRSRRRNETGGLSGVPLFETSTNLLRRVYRITQRRLPLVGTGGIVSGRDAYEKIRAGASLIQLYTAMVFHGPILIERIKGELTELLKADGFAHISDAVGIDVI